MRSKSFSLQKEFEKFSKSSWGLELCLPAGRQGLKIIFRSKKSGVKGLLDFLKKSGRGRYNNLIIFDKIVGRGAALLAAYLEAKIVYGKIGSKPAVKTLKKHKIKFYFQKTVPSILNREQSDLCPFEKLSFNRAPEEFYRCLNKKSQQ